MWLPALFLALQAGTDLPPPDPDEIERLEQEAAEAEVRVVEGVDELAEDVDALRMFA